MTRRHFQPRPERSTRAAEFVPRLGWRGYGRGIMTIPENYVDLLDAKGFAHVATIGPNGEPQCSPVWYGWDGELLSFSLTKVRQKYRNLAANPSIAVSIIDPENPYRYLEVRGTVERIDEDPDAAFIDSMALKYMGVDTYAGHQPGDERVVIRVRPGHTSSMG